MIINRIILILFSSILLAINIYCGTVDSLPTDRNKTAPKVGYNLAPFPEFMVDPVVGVYFGINASLYDYGSGTDYPNYNQLYNLNAAWGTKGKTNFSFRYERYGKHIFSFKVAYTVANLYPFYGYNGYQTYYNRGYESKSSDEFITSAFYNYHQERTQIDGYIQDEIQESRIHWLIGTDINIYNIKRVNFEKLNKNIENVSFIDAPTLYDRFVEWGIISENEKNGGWANSIRGALLYDTRDRLTNPMKGVWSQITLRYSPTVFGNIYNGLQLNIKHHQFHTIIPQRVSFAYRLRYDATFGNLSFYNRQILADGAQGYGGANGLVRQGYGTIWGIHQNRAIAKQMALGNFEIRAKFFYFRMFNQNWHLALVPLFHTGIIIEPYDMDLTNVSEGDKDRFFTDSYEGWYSAAGVGGKIVMNENIVIGLDWARALNKQAGTDAVYIGLAYSF